MGAKVFSRTTDAEFMGCSVRIIGLEDFIATKIFAGGPVDIRDCLGVLKISGSQVNWILLKKITAGYGKDCLKLLSKILKNNS